jgi:hypothetical protein
MAALATPLLTKRQIREAAKMWREQPGRNGFRSGRLYEVIIGGKPYPPKAIAAYANEIACDEILLPRDFVGAREGKWHREFKRLGFEIRPKSSASEVQDGTILRYREDERFLDCQRAFLVTGTQRHEALNRSLLALNQSGYWYLSEGRVSPGDALFLILPSDAPGGYPRELFGGVVSKEPNRELHGGKARFQVKKFHKLDSIESDVKQFLAGKLPPQGDRVSAVWDDAKDFKVIEPAKGMGGNDDEDEFPEGKESYKKHKSRERNSKVVKLAKLRRFQETGKLECEACGFDFVKVYGERGKGFIEAHHTIPFASVQGETRVRAKDLALVCSNCHRMLHRLRPLMKAEDLKRHLARVARRR